MSANFSAGVRDSRLAATWHKQESQRLIETDEDMIRAGRESGAWPISIGLRDMFATDQKIKIPGKGVIGRFADKDAMGRDMFALRGLGAVGDRYQPTDPASWDDLIRAVCRTGAKPVMAFSLRDFTRPVATFELPDLELRKGRASSHRFVISDSFDGSLRLTFGDTAIDVVCSNTWRMAIRESGQDMAKLTHSGDFAAKCRRAEQAIEACITQGKAAAETYRQAYDYRVTPDLTREILEALYPIPSAKDASKAAISRAETKQRDVLQAMRRPENAAQDTLATIWNGLTFLVDREADGSARTSRTDPIDSMLFGTRGAQVARISNLMQTVLTTGKVAA